MLTCWTVGDDLSLFFDRIFSVDVANYYGIYSFEFLFITLRLLVVPVESMNLVQFGLSLICIYTNKPEIYNWEWKQGTEKPLELHKSL